MSLPIALIIVISTTSLEILKILLRDESLAADACVAALAKRTEGFSGSDLKRMIF